MEKIVRILYREIPLFQPQGDCIIYDKLYDLYLDGETPKLRAGSRDFDISREDFDGFVQLCEEIGAAEKLDANNPWHMRIKMSGPGAMGRYLIAFDDGTAASADNGPQEIPQRFKELEKKYTPASEPVIDGAWKCRCGQTNTSRYCCSCGMSAADGKEN